MIKIYIFWCAALVFLSIHAWADMLIIPCSNLALAGYGVRCNEIGDEEISKTMNVEAQEGIDLTETCNKVKSPIQSFDARSGLLGSYRYTAFFLARGSEVHYVNCHTKPLEEVDFSQSPQKSEIEDGAVRLKAIKAFFRI